ncbi:uncharacterized protein DUF397 [Actinocorallia herbida]|uniref:Uncharacterized protein DUF397 n=1 Tax=Actinocorallia herbida TaxID=58109 RepID=A0A3N1CNR7_9ACTN|nr:DUF397 domain-containing protein [Actinocorallia herbida]ROO82969.1 uncharacterized protein DUF397 [Actinocorallia herbida]
MTASREELCTVWRKSTRSTGQGGNCVELADGRDAVSLRDSKRPADGRVVVSRVVLRALFDGVRG